MLNNYTYHDNGKGVIIKFEELENMHDQINALINRTYERKPNWTKEEHAIKIDILMEAQESDTFQKSIDDQ